jgi:hypothetical protein
MLKQVTAWLHRSPVAKTVAVTAAGGALGAVIPLVQAGNTDPAALAAAAQSGAVTALTALAALWIKRPVDATATDKGEVK